MSEDILPGYSTFKTYHRLSNRYATIGDTNKLPIECIGTTVFTLNVWTILTCNALHIPALHGPLYSLQKHRQIPGYGVYSLYKDSSYLFFPDFILQVEDSYNNISVYYPLVRSHQGPIDYIEPKSTWSKNMATPSDRSSTITHDDNHQSPNIITSDCYSLCTEPPLSI